MISSWSQVVPTFKFVSATGKTTFLPYLPCGFLRVDFTTETGHFQGNQWIPVKNPHAIDPDRDQRFRIAVIVLPAPATFIRVFGDQAENFEAFLDNTTLRDFSLVEAPEKPEPEYVGLDEEFSLTAELE